MQINVQYKQKHFKIITYICIIHLFGFLSTTSLRNYCGKSYVFLVLNTITSKLLGKVLNRDVEAKCLGKTIIEMKFD